MKKFSFCLRSHPKQLCESRLSNEVLCILAAQGAAKLPEPRKKPCFSQGTYTFFNKGNLPLYMPESSIFLELKLYYLAVFQHLELQGCIISEY